MYGQAGRVERYGANLVEAEGPLGTVGTTVIRFVQTFGNEADSAREFGARDKQIFPGKPSPAKAPKSSWLSLAWS